MFILWLRSQDVFFFSLASMNKSNFIFAVNRRKGDSITKNAFDWLWANLCYMHVVCAYDLTHNDNFLSISVANMQCILRRNVYEWFLISYHHGEEILLNQAPHTSIFDLFRYFLVFSVIKQASYLRTFGLVAHLFLDYSNTAPPWVMQKNTTWSKHVGQAILNDMI